MRCGGWFDSIPPPLPPPLHDPLSLLLRLLRPREGGRPVDSFRSPLWLQEAAGFSSIKHQSPLFPCRGATATRRRRRRFFAFSFFPREQAGTLGVGLGHILSVTDDMSWYPDDMRSVRGVCFDSFDHSTRTLHSYENG